MIVIVDRVITEAIQQNVANAKQFSIERDNVTFHKSVFTSVVVNIFRSKKFRKHALSWIVLKYYKE